MPYLDDPDSAVRQSATAAVMHLLDLPELADQRPVVAERLLRSASDADPLERAGIALTLDEVRAALSDPSAVDDLLEEQPPQLETRLRFYLVEALLRRTTTFAEVADIAVAIAAITRENAVREERGPLLKRAFPQGRTDEMSLAQERDLAALVANDACWGVNGDRYAVLEEISLPTERDELRALLSRPGTAPARS